jgi:heme/copper-type cytochrome/quinol oxidase subunit 2
MGVKLKERKKIDRQKRNKVKLILSFPVIFSIILFAAAALSSCTSEDAAVGAAAGLAGIWIIFLVLVWLVVAAIGIFFFVIWIITLIDCAKRDNDEFPDATENSKLIWILVIVLAGGIGAIIYYFIVMRKMPRKK